MINPNEYCEQDFSDLFNKLVPADGNAETKEGELVRALNRIMYRASNDGDVWWDGYGTETLGQVKIFIENFGGDVIGLNETLEAARQIVCYKLTDYGGLLNGAACNKYYEKLEDAAFILMKHIEGLNGSLKKGQYDMYAEKDNYYYTDYTEYERECRDYDNEDEEYD
jgi:hypothetical protein